MIKDTQTIRQLLLRNCLSVFDHFVGLALEGLNAPLQYPFLKNYSPEIYVSFANITPLGLLALHKKQSFIYLEHISHFLLVFLLLTLNK